MKRRRRLQRPLQRGRAGPPRIAGSPLLLGERIDHAHEEHDETSRRDIGSNGSNLLQASNCVGIICNSSRHSRQSKEMHREKRKIDPDKCQPEVQLAESLRSTRIQSFSGTSNTSSVSIGSSFDTYHIDINRRRHRQPRRFHIQPQADLPIRLCVHVGTIVVPLQRLKSNQTC